MEDLTIDSPQQRAQNYYDSFAEQEWTRLENSGDGQIEWIVNTRAIQERLPNNPCLILDIGGGPGRYAIWLAKLGHKVVLADLSPKLIEIATKKIQAEHLEKSIESVVADATDLSRWNDESFDFVLCMGPFYHLPAEHDRIRASQEVLRVLKPGGVAFIALMTRYALIRRTLGQQDETHHLSDRRWLNDLLSQGVFLNDIPGRFDHGFGMPSGDVRPYFESQGFLSIELLSSESITIGIQSAVNRIKESGDDEYGVALQIINDAARDPSIQGLASHLLYVGRKPEH